MIDINDYAYCLPEDKIARFPQTERDSSKLLVYRNNSIMTDVFSNIFEYFEEGDMAVYNNTRVISARIEMTKETGACIEIFCLEPYMPDDYQLSFAQQHNCQWKCMIGNLRRWKSGFLKKRVICNGEEVELRAEKTDDNSRIQVVRFSWDKEIDFGAVLDVCGSMPVPPYLKRKAEEIDQTCYQTVFSKNKGSVAAPTAGLHFTPQLLKKLENKGIKQNEITLHVGTGTFRPIHNINVYDHDMHVEYFFVSAEVIRNIVSNKGILTAVGTTTLRTLESLYWMGVKMLYESLPLNNLHLGQWEYNFLPQDVTMEQSLGKLCEALESQKQEMLYGSTKIMIVPGYRFRICSRLITNFHQPKSTLLLLVSAFTGNGWKEIYDYALSHDYRFLSYGDGSLLELSE